MVLKKWLEQICLRESEKFPDDEHKATLDFWEVGFSDAAIEHQLHLDLLYLAYF